MMIIKFSGAVYLQNEPWGFLAVYIQKEDCSALKSNLVETEKWLIFILAREQAKKYSITFRFCKSFIDVFHGTR